jgi:hypothetical protein
MSAPKGDEEGVASTRPVGAPGSGPRPGTRAYVVLDPRKRSSAEIVAAIIAMVEASRNTQG